MQEVILQTAKVASEWWGNVLVNPRFNSGDDSIGGLFAMTSAMSFTADVTIEQKEAFIALLSDKISKEIKDGYGLNLDVDYAPCQILCESAKEAGIKTANFPWKTIMHIEIGFVSVRYGYGASSQVLIDMRS